MALELNGTTGVQGNSGAFVAGTAVASTSGTSIDFTSIPSWVKRITVMLSGVSSNGSSPFLIQLGDSGGIEITGYDASVFNISAQSDYTAGFGLQTAISAASTYSGQLIISLITSNTWVTSGNIGASGSGNAFTVNGTKTLSATLDRVRITTSNGTDTFDAGSINILFE
jgi:hypothetical protein